MSCAPSAQAQPEGKPGFLQGNQDSPAAHWSQPGTLCLVCGCCRMGEVCINWSSPEEGPARGLRHMNHGERLGEDLLCCLTAAELYMRSHRGEGAGLCSEVYSGRVRDWPKMEKEGGPAGQKGKIKTYHWKKLPREGLESIAGGFQRSTCSDPAFGFGVPL